MINNFTNGENNLVTNTIHMNYTYTSLVSALTQDPSILRNGVTNQTPLIRSCSHSGWNDFNNDGLRYLFYFNFKINDWIIDSPTTISNCELICHDAVQFNYNCPLTKTINGKVVPITLDDILKDPLSRTIYSNQSGDSGANLYEFALKIQSAHRQNIRQCPVDVRLIKYNHPVYYTIEYNLISSDGQLTVKRSIVGIIKYKKANGEDNIAFLGTAIEEYILE